MNRRFRMLAVWLLALLLCTGAAAIAEENAAPTEKAVFTLPSALKTIGEEAFCGDTSLEKVILPEGASEIQSKAFAGSSLSEIQLPDSLTAIADDAFDGCGEITVLVNKDSYAYDYAVEKGYIVKLIHTPAEYFNYEIENDEITITGYTGEDKEVIIPSEIEGLPVKHIGAYAFEACQHLERIDLPAGIVSIGAGAFDLCTQLNSITVDAENPIYTSIDGVLYSKAAMELILYPSGRITDDSYSIISGDSARFPALPDEAALEKGYTLTSSNPELVSVEGNMITAANAAGRATITLSLNTEEGAAPVQTSYTVDVIAAASVALPPEEISLRPLSRVSILYDIIPSNLIGTFEISPTDETMIGFDPETGEISSLEISGSTELLFKTFNAEFRCPVTVLEAPYFRALVVSSYNNSGASSDLPFAANNVSTMKNTLARFDHLGRKYTGTTITNPTKSALRSIIDSTFADADEDDVSLLYITTHGHNGSTGSGYSGYYFSLAPNYSTSNSSTYVTAAELMDCLSEISGNIILVLDSCYSGAFIQQCSGQLAAHGRISVLTAQTGDKPAAYYVGKSSATHAEFLTYALCYGLGTQMTNTSLETMPADWNDDGRISVSEAFSYARIYAVNLIDAYRSTFSASSIYGIKVPGCNTQAKFDAWSQNPQIYLAPEADELILYAR